MRRRFISAFVSLAFLLLVAIEAQGQYTRPPIDPPTASDLLAYQGQQQTVVVQIVNATPYDIYLKDTHLLPAPASTPPPPLTSSSVSITDQTEMLDRDRDNKKSFMFAPAGIPWYIPGAPLEAFHNPDPNYRNTFTKPYTIVLSWDDHDGVIPDNWLKWTVKQVAYCTEGHSDSNNKWNCTNYGNGDADLGLWMYRIENKPDKVDSAFFPSFVQDFLNEALAMAGLVTDPVNPIGWITMFIATKDLAIGSTEFMKANSQPEQDCDTHPEFCNKLYLASYVVPADSSFCSQVSNTDIADCSPTLLKLRPSSTNPDPTGDAVASNWTARAAGACLWPGGCPRLGDGPAFAPEAELVVTAHLLRSQPAPSCPPSTLSTYTSYTCPLGRLNMFMITIMRPTEFAVAALSGGSTNGSAASTGSVAATTNLGVAATDSTDSIADTQSVGAAANNSMESLTPVRREVRMFLLQAGAGPLREMLKQQGLKGLLTLRSIVQNNLDFSQQQLLRQMVRHMLAGDRPTSDERELVRFITKQFQAQLKPKQAQLKTK